jgi:hypothetical protein
MEVVQLPVKREVFERLKALAEPLVDDASSVIERLIGHWESSPPRPRNRTVVLPEAEPSVWRSARGGEFPVGTKLRATYLSHFFGATVAAGGIEFNGHTYDNPSSAGIAAKESVGTKRRAATTNGWDFWEMQDPKTGRWVSIDTLRSSKVG